MGFLGSIVGAVTGNSGGAGMNYKAGQADITNPTDKYQVDQAYLNQQNAAGATQNALGTQNAFVNALAGQNGVNNQSNALSNINALQNQLTGGVGVQQQGISAQQALANAINSQNGVGNQNAAFDSQQALVNQLSGLNGAANQQNVFNQQQALSDQYGNIAAGQGPNPAQAMLAQATGNNVANQAALMAGQRGAGSNVGLLGRQAAMMGGNIQQQAAGQAATMQANQSLAAMQAQAGQQAAMAGTAQNQIGNQSANTQALANMANQQVGQAATINQQVAGLGATQIGQQQAQQQAAANLASQQVSQQAAGIQNQNAAAQNAQSLAQQNQQTLINAMNQHNSNQVSNMGSQNSANASVSQVTADKQGDFFNGVLKGASTAAMSDKNNKEDIKDGEQSVEQFLESLKPSSYNYKDTKYGKGEQTGVMAQDLEKTSAGKAMVVDTPEGKMVDYGKGFGTITAAVASLHDRIKELEGKSPKKMNQGGEVTPFVDHQAKSTAPAAVEAPKAAAPVKPQLSKDEEGGAALGELAMAGAAMMSDGGQVANLKENTSGENHIMSYLMGKSPVKMANGGMIDSTLLASKGAVVPGKAKVEGDSVKNDTVPAILSPGEVVIPRSVMQSKDPVGNAAKFVAAIMAKNNLKR